MEYMDFTGFFATSATRAVLTTARGRDAGAGRAHGRVASVRWGGPTFLPSQAKKVTTGVAVLRSRLIDANFSMFHHFFVLRGDGASVKWG